MRPPLYKCLFCLSTTNPFNRIEHPIPESLGNDDLILEPGWVCDPCNQYFGSKVEALALNSTPFGIERVVSGVKTKKGRLSEFRNELGLVMHSVGLKDQVAFSGDFKSLFGRADGSRRFLITPRNVRDDLSIARLLLKIGIELISLTEEVDAYSTLFDDARRFARYAAPGSDWEFGEAIYPSRQDLVISENVDEFGPLVNHQLYQYWMGRLQSGTIGICFMYGVFIFAVMLSTSSVGEFVNDFNLSNSYEMTIVKAASASK